MVIEVQAMLHPFAFCQEGEIDIVAEMAQEDSPLLFGTVLEPPRRLSSLNRIAAR